VTVINRSYIAKIARFAPQKEHGHWSSLPDYLRDPTLGLSLA